MIVIADMVNDTRLSVRYNAEIKINGEVQNTQRVHFKPSESHEITFVITAGKPGDYKVEIDGSSVEFTVVSE